MARRKSRKKQIGYTHRELRSGSWQFRVSNGTSQPDCRTFPDFDTGRQWAERLLTLHRDGGYGTHRLAQLTSLADALDRYGREVSSQKRGYRQELSRISVLKALPIASLPLTELRPRDFATLKTEWLIDAGPNGKKPLAPSTVVKYLAMVHHMFETARTDWGFESLQNPIRDVKKPSIRNERERLLTFGERKAILKEAHRRLKSRSDAKPHFINLFKFSIRCPQRQGELLACRWGDVHWTDASLRIARGKDQKTRYAPLLPPALRMLIMMKKLLSPSPSDRIFPTTKNAVAIIWREIRADLRLTDLHWHDLRHQGCTEAARLLRFDIAALQKVSGHRTLSQLRRYVNYNVQSVHGAVAREQQQRRQRNEVDKAKSVSSLEAQIEIELATLRKLLLQRQDAGSTEQ